MAGVGRVPVSFALYREEVPAILPFEDYGALLEQARGKARALEFGPGYSTFALIEAGAEEIATCEHDEGWRAAAIRRFASYRQVSVRAYANAPEVTVEGLAGTFDIAFVDSPVGQGPRRVALPGQEQCNRLNTVEFALRHAPLVLLHDARRTGEMITLKRLAAQGHRVSLIETAKGIARIERA